MAVFLRGELELFPAFGLATFTSDWLSPLFTLARAGLALLAAWALGRTSGPQHLIVLAVLVIFGTTALIASQPGGAYNDVTCIALLLCSAAIFVHGGQWLGPSLVAALAGGLAAGTKLTMIVPAAALAVGACAASPPPARWRRLGVWTGGAAASGGFWFARNLAHNGNPRPVGPSTSRRAIGGDTALLTQTSRERDVLVVLRLDSDRALTRAQFLRVAGGAAGVLALPSVASAAGGTLNKTEAFAAGSTAGHAFQSFRSRPDLRPPIVTQIAGAGSGGAAAQAVAGEGYSFLAPQRGGGCQAGLMIVDSSGELVWFRPLPRGRWATSFAVQRYRGQPVLTWWEGRLRNPPGYGHGEGVIVDSSYREVARVRAGRGRSADLHEFVLTPEGTALITCYPATVQKDLSLVGGAGPGPVLESIIQEIDVATGRVLLEWRSLDHIGLAESYSATYDPVHVNSIEVMPDGNLLVSARHTWALYKLHRRSGRVIWRLGGKRSDFHLGSRAKFSWQHDARHAAPNTITLFDDGAGLRATESQSRGVALNVDFKRRAVKLDRAYYHPRPILASAMGSMRTLPDGNVVVDFGSAPVLSEFAADGSLIADLHLAAAQASYRGWRGAWSAAPATSPALAARAGPASGAITLYASWNGATALASWRVSVGPSPGSLAPVTVTPRAGFETAISIQAASGYASVSALDASGRSLATSRTIQLP